MHLVRGRFERLVEAPPRVVAVAAGVGKAGAIRVIARLEFSTLFKAIPPS